MKAAARGMLTGSEGLRVGWSAGSSRILTLMTDLSQVVRDEANRQE